MTSACQQALHGPERSRAGPSVRTVFNGVVRRKRFCELVKMSKAQMLRRLINQRLTAAAEEICGLFERTIAEYEEELCSSKEENERHRKLLDAVLNPTVRLQRAEEPEPRHIKKDQEDPEPPDIKEVQEELSTNQEGEQLPRLEEAGIKPSFTHETFMLCYAQECCTKMLFI
ncbi:hypothetical protein EYF80_017156 [Liparis tanakae]|uniref:Uncharacterized protein n=1 Tax=Liparis tanakae TaxID=230148 RepID=A0A4Z2I3B0_9TELE|nr:hypothetical protein EYF80_017156 [Liparis tanakae]